MEKQNDRNPPQSRVKKGWSTINYLIIVIVLIAVTGFYFYVQKHPGTSFDKQTSMDTTAGATDQVEQVEQTARQSSDPGPVNTTMSADQQSAESGESHASSSNADSGDKGGIPATKQNHSAVDEILDQSLPGKSASSNPQMLINEINLFFTHLDQQPYMQAFALKEPSKVYFSKLLQRLSDKPPVVLRETDNLFTLLQNTAHFYRILGQKNIDILKAVLDNEKDSYEPVLKAFYGLTSYPEVLKDEFSLELPADAINSYAGFFLNTMGGRLYLSRRDSLTRMVVNYYAIMIIDRANGQGNGRLGIDLRPSLKSLVEEMENSGNRLQLKVEYLDALYDLQERYY